MRFSTSRPADGDHYQSEEYWLHIDLAAHKVFLEKTLVRYGPGDDFQKVVDLEISFEEFRTNLESQNMVADWFGEQALQNVLRELER